MGTIASSVGHLCIDLSHIEMTGEQQRALLRAVEATVVRHLAEVASHYKIVTISLSPNNGARPRPEDEPAPAPAPPPPSPEPPKP